MYTCTQVMQSITLNNVLLQNLIDANFILLTYALT